MSLDENDDIRPRPEIWEKAVIGLAALLTLSGLGVAFFSFTLKPLPKPKPAPEPTEITVGIGQGSAIHPRVVQDPASAPHP
jgi:hypothetical protein